MKVRLFGLVLMAMLVATEPQLAFAQDNPTFMQKLVQLTETVKVTVVQWWHSWVGGPTQAPGQRAVAGEPATGAVAGEPAAGPQPPAPVNSAAGPQSGSVTNSAAPSAAQTTGQTPVATSAVSGMRAPLNAAANSSMNPKVPVQNVRPSPAEQIREVRQKLKTKESFSFKTKGQAPGSEMKTAKSGVPSFDVAALKKIRSIPRLNVGKEPEISKQVFSLPDWDWRIKQLQEVKQIPSPATIPMTGAASQSVNKAQPMKLQPADKDLIESKVTHERISQIDWKIKDTAEIAVKPVELTNEDDVKMLVTRILFEKNRCHLVLGLADEMATKPQYHIEAQYESGFCAKDMKMNQVAYERLSDVIRKNDPEYSVKALNKLAKDLPPVFEPQFYELVKPLEGNDAYFSDKHVKDEIFYRTAKGAFKAAHYKTAEKWAERVSADSDFGPYAQYVIGISQFGAKEKAKAKATLEKLSETVDHSGDNILKGLVDVDLARMEFSAHKFEAALPLYQKVPKDHPMWVQALIEQGWAQLATEDFAGAIGNMYSLHSPYFRILYQPESFVVRTIGYLNICQYGDAYRSMSKLETDYRDWEDRLNNYLSPQRTPAAVYNTIKTYLHSQSTTDVEGLPFQVVREAARGKEFLNTQVGINQKADEIGLFPSVSDKIRRDKDNVKLRAEQAKKRAEALAIKIAAATKAHMPQSQIDDLKSQMERERTRSVPNRYELAILDQSLQAFGHFQKIETDHILESQKKLVAVASEILYERFKQMRTEISRVLENNEFLRYEVFAGSGENIRFQVAGGQVNGDNRLPASVKPQKMMNWSFDGEFWADEIGNYRSSLKNNCPRNAGGG